MKKLISLFSSLFLVITHAVLAHDAETSRPFQKFHAHQIFESHSHAGWESRYFSEGRDALNGKSLWAGSFELGYDHFSGGVWYGRSSDHSYDEWQYNLSITQEMKGFEFYAGYTHLVFAKDDESDDEWSVGISYGDLPWDMESALDATYSVDADGAFLEWSNGKSFSISEAAELSANGIFGWNEGYVSDGHDGMNYFAFSLSGERALNENFSLVGHGTQSWAIDRDLTYAGDDQLKDFFHVGIGIEWNF